MVLAALMHSECHRSPSLSPIHYGTAESVAQHQAEIQRLPRTGCGNTVCVVCAVKNFIKYVTEVCIDPVIIFYSL